MGDIPRGSPSSLFSGGRPNRRTEVLLQYFFFPPLPQIFPVPLPFPPPLPRPIKLYPMSSEAY